MKIVKENPLVTDLVGKKTTKLDSYVNFFGICDELSCHIMENRCLIKDKDTRDELEAIVKKLSSIMGEVAGGKSRLLEDDIIYIRSLVKKYETNNGIVTEFVLPGQNVISSHIHITRCVARRCELAYAKVYSDHGGSDIIFEYLNKLSTLFYYIALKYEK